MILRSRPGTELALTVLICAGAAGIALYATSRTWLLRSIERSAPIPDTTSALTGADLSPVLPALALVALAGAGALIAARGRGRATVGAVLALGGGAAVLLAGHALVTTAGLVVAWPVLCAASGALVLAAGVVTMRRGRAWPGLGSRYERPASAGISARADSAAGQGGGQGGGQALWDALERGDDPTLR